MSLFTPPCSRGRSRFRLTYDVDLYEEQNPDELFDRSAHACEGDSDSDHETQNSRTNARFLMEYAKPRESTGRRRGTVTPTDVDSGRQVSETEAVAAVIDISENNHLTTRPSVRHAQATKSPPKKFSLKKAFGFFSSLLETFMVTATSAEPTANMTATSHSQQQTFRLLNGRIIVDEGPAIDFTLNGTNGPGNLGDLFDTFEHDLSLPPSPYESHTGEREDRETPTPSAQTAPSSNNVSLARASTVFSEYSQPPSKPLISLLGQHLASTATSGATRVDNGHTSTTDGGQIFASTERAADQGHQADQNELRQPTLPGANTPKERIGRQPMTQTTKKVIATLPPFLGRTRAATSKQIGEEAERHAKRPSTRSAVPTTPVQVTSRQRDLQTARTAILLKQKAKKVFGGITDQVSKRGAKKQRSAVFEQPVRRLKVERGKAVVVIPGEKVDLKEYQGFD